MAKDKVEVEVITQTKKSIAGLAKLAVGIFAAKKAFDVIIKVVKDVGEAYGKQELAIVGMESALRATGEYTPQVSENLQQLASDLQDVTTYGDEVTLSAIATLQSLADLNEKGIADTIPLIQDFTAGFKNMGMTMETAASLFGKTLGSTTNALTRYGIVVDMTGTKAERLADIQDQMTEKFGGRAADLADTYAGRIESLGNQYGDLKEQIGFLTTQNMPAFIDLTSAVIDKMSGWIGKIIDAKLEVKKFRESLMGMTQEEIQALIDAQQELIDSNLDLSYSLMQVIESEESSRKEKREAKKELKELEEEYDSLVKTQKAHRDQLETIVKGQKALNEVFDDGSEAAASLAEFHTILDKAYAETERGAIEAMEAQIAHFESMLTIAKDPTVIEKLEYIIEMYKEELEVLKDVGEAAEETAEVQIAAFTTAADESLAYHKHRIEQIIIEREAEAEALEDYKRIAGEKIAIAQNTAGMFQDTFGAYFDWQLQELENNLASGQITQEQYDEKKKQLMRNEAKAEKAKALFDIAVNTASAFVAALPRIGLAALVAGLGITRAAFVAATPIPAFAEGGVVTEPTVALIGEKGPEAVVPLTSPGMGGGGSITLQNNVYLGTKKIYSDLAKAIRNKQIPLYRGALVD